ncbi:HAD-IB family hydrolase [Grimontia sp. NTOU-MAR1]|uniref:HAD-IB family hydrolase n=1 Tax=Grimontia sp. NTOU-MAR1 TaxID=3111011 RepID=UPI002DBB2D5D|nr:HAD-IB family hydrolase [Grimontia sp. NTOU-MAR1]WRW00329.1 HAD-IB family hydrolase [Grimontia sp. NTOU-MAR1]
MNLALFDFYGTLTKEDTSTAFLFYATSKPRLAIGFALVWPVILLYKLGLLPARKTRPVLACIAFWYRCEEDVDVIAKRFAAEYLPTELRPDAMEMLAKHKANGDDVYLVSATLNIYLRHLCKRHDMKLLCSTMSVKNGRFTGRYLNGDCSCENKAAAVQKTVDLNAYSQVYAYGDTDEDLPMLALADVKYLCGNRISTNQ